MNIAIIEHETDVYEALKLFPQRDCLYLSVSAEASYKLSKMNIKFLCDEDILSPQEFKRIGSENFEITERWINRLEEIIQSNYPIFHQKKFYPFKWHFYRIKILVDAVRINRILLERLVEKENPTSIGSPAGSLPGKIHDYHLFFHKNDSLYGLLAEKIAKQNNIEINVWAKVGTEKASDQTKHKMRSYLSRIKRILRFELNNLIKWKKKKDALLVSSLAYEIVPLSRVLMKEYDLLYYRDLMDIRFLRLLKKIKLTSQKGELIESDIKANFKTINPTDDPIVNEILGERIQSYAEEFIPILWRELHCLESIDSQKNFKGAIFPFGAVDSFHGLPIYYFESKNKPVVVIQHGSYGFALNQTTEYSEFGHNGYFLAWGDGINEMYNERKKGSCNIISTGSYLIEEIRRKRKKRKTIKDICYVPGTYRGYIAYYPNGQPCRDSKLFIMETNFLTALAPYQDKFQITYKIAPEAVNESPYFGKNPMLDWIKENLPGVRIESRPLQAVIHKFDLFIIDWPSTTLIQAMASGGEILVYVGNDYHTPSSNALKMIEKRCVVGFDEGDIKKKIRWLLDNGEVVSDIDDTSFLEKYGVHSNDGKSLKRMMDRIIRLCK